MIVDDHEIVRSGLRQMLEADPSVEVIGEASTGEEGIHLTFALKPHIVMLDIQLPDISGLEVTRRLLSNPNHTKILIVSAISHGLFPFRLLEAGVQGYLTKNASPEELIRSVKSIYAGKRLISSEIAQQLALSKSSTQDSIFSFLSERETEVMLMVIRGLEVKQIAKKLSISSKTVHSYRNRLFEKLHVKSNTALTLLAIKQGLVALEET